ncbi:MAG TPA: choice-of-anchor L domain-containing protein [bacterium]|nr:choice-of-anchor L domain-containing protein [bacterium]
MRRSSSRYIFLFLIGVTGVASGQALSVTPLGGNSPTILVQSLMGIGLTYSNVTYQGNGSSAGTFTGGSAIVGFPSGIVLSNGAAASVKGPPVIGGTSTCNSLPGDADLAVLAGTSPASIFDASVLQFDFIPTYNTITFQYVFASDEYNQFIGAFDDVFGFFLNGVNVALVPGTTTAVSVNTVNNCVNPAYFIDNSGGQSNGVCSVTKPSAGLNTTMWGLTTVLSVTASVNPGVTNHIKLAIGDAGDCNLDSNVFIQANSFSSGPTATPTNTPTASPTRTPTATRTPTNTPTITPTFPPFMDDFEVDKNAFTPPGESVSITVGYSQFPGNYSLRIYNSAGEHIRTLDSQGLTTPIRQTYVWDGTNKYGDKCASGIYLIALEEPFNRKLKKVLLIR